MFFFADWGIPVHCELFSPITHQVRAGPLHPQLGGSDGVSQCSYQCSNLHLTCLCQQEPELVSGRIRPSSNTEQCWLCSGHWVPAVVWPQVKGWHLLLLVFGTMFYLNHFSPPCFMGDIVNANKCKCIFFTFRGCAFGQLRIPGIKGQWRTLANSSAPTSPPLMWPRSSGCGRTVRWTAFAGQLVRPNRFQPRLW